MYCKTQLCMENQLHNLLEKAKQDSLHIQTRPAFEQFKAQYVGPQGGVTTIMKAMSGLPTDQKPKIGQAINKTKKSLEEIFHNTLRRITEIEKAQILGPKIDPSLPFTEHPLGSKHPLSLLKEEIQSILKSLGFWIEEGNQVESEWYCFDALNTPASHPARDAQDTFYMPASAQFSNISKKEQERYVLRTHTSNVQIRKMMTSAPPLKIATIGRCFRRDTADATHSANFHQLEGLYVDQGISIKDLKNILDYFLKNLLGKNIQTRLRPSFFPFTEPSYELDVRLYNFGKLSGRWLEILGCGLVDPKVFEAVGYDSTIWSGFAWGMGLERLAMIRYQIDDVRYFYQNDMRFLSQFTA